MEIIIQTLMYSVTCVILSMSADLNFILLLFSPELNSNVHVLSTIMFIHVIFSLTYLAAYMSIIAQQTQWSRLSRNSFCDFLVFVLSFYLVFGWIHGVSETCSLVD